MFGMLERLASSRLGISRRGMEERKQGRVRCRLGSLGGSGIFLITYDVKTNVLFII